MMRPLRTEGCDIVVPLLSDGEGRQRWGEWDKEDSRVATVDRLGPRT